MSRHLSILKCVLLTVVASAWCQGPLLPTRRPSARRLPDNSPPTRYSSRFQPSFRDNSFTSPAVYPGFPPQTRSQPRRGGVDRGSGGHDFPTRFRPGEFAPGFPPPSSSEERYSDEPRRDLYDFVPDYAASYEEAPEFRDRSDDYAPSGFETGDAHRPFLQGSDRRSEEQSRRDFRERVSKPQREEGHLSEVLLEVPNWREEGKSSGEREFKPSRKVNDNAVNQEHQQPRNVVSGSSSEFDFTPSAESDDDHPGSLSFGLSFSSPSGSSKEDQFQSRETGPAKNMGDFTSGQSSPGRSDLPPLNEEESSEISSFRPTASGVENYSGKQVEADWDLPAPSTSERAVTTPTTEVADSKNIEMYTSREQRRQHFRSKFQHKFRQYQAHLTRLREKKKELEGGESTVSTTSSSPASTTIAERPSPPTTGATATATDRVTKTTTVVTTPAARRPIGVSEEDFDPKSVDVKELLRKGGHGSIVEVLQKKGYTIADLLKKKKGAVLAVLRSQDKAGKGKQVDSATEKPILKTSTLETAKIQEDERTLERSTTTRTWKRNNEALFPKLRLKNHKYPSFKFRNYGLTTTASTTPRTSHSTFDIKKLHIFTTELSSILNPQEDEEEEEDENLHKSVTPTEESNVEYVTLQNNSSTEFLSDVEGNDNNKTDKEKEIIDKEDIGSVTVKPTIKKLSISDLLDMKKDQSGSLQSIDSLFREEDEYEDSEEIQDRTRSYDKESGFSEGGSYSFGGNYQYHPGGLNPWLQNRGLVTKRVQEKEDSKSDGDYGYFFNDTELDEWDADISDIGDQFTRNDASLGRIPNGEYDIYEDYDLADARLPKGIKSAIIVSCIVGTITIIIFCVIFLLCLFKQMKTKLRVPANMKGGESMFTFNTLLTNESDDKKKENRKGKKITKKKFWIFSV